MHKPPGKPQALEEVQTKRRQEIPHPARTWKLPTPEGEVTGNGLL